MLVRSQGLGWLAVFAFGELALWAAVPRPARVATTIIYSYNSINRCVPSSAIPNKYYLTPFFKGMIGKVKF
jgi:hypothetical protein